MKNLFIKDIQRIASPLVLTVALLATSCKTDFYEEVATNSPSSGSIDATTYVSIGTTITAGFADNALYTEGQNAAYPNLIAQKLKEVNNGLVFNQPAINSENGWAGGSNGKSRLVIPGCSTVSISPIAQAGESTLLPFTGEKSTLHNLAVPFLPINAINSAVAPAGTAYNQPKGYFDRVIPASSAGIASEAKKRNPTLFTIWLGYVDALQYATSGGTKPLISTAEFKLNLNALLDSILVNPNAKGVVANIPYVDLIPVVTNNNRRLTSATDPAKSPNKLTDEQVANYNAALGGTFLKGDAGKNYNFVIRKGDGGLRELSSSKDFIVRGNVLDSVGIGERDPKSVRACEPSYILRTEVGFKTPISNNAVLDADEIKVLRKQIDEYNQAITEVVNSRNGEGGTNTRIAIADLNSFYTKLTDPLYGIQYGSSIIRANQPNLGPDFGGFYSLDRTNPTPKGQALIANEFIKTINAKFGATLNLFNPDEFRANQVPTN